jgi:hypothetical protein
LKALKHLLKIPIYLILLVVIYLNVRLYHTQSYDREKDYDEDVYAQLQHLKGEMHSNAAAYKMQRLFPEGFVFQNALYGLTWCDLIHKDTDTSIRREALAEIDWAIDELLSENGTAIFSENLPLKYGVFYRGWTNYLIGKRLIIDDSPTKLKILYALNSQEISAAFDSSSIPYLESYYSASWPADNMVAIASLALKTKITKESKTTISSVDTWMSTVKSKLDKHGRIPHAVNWKTGNTVQESRGNSMSLMLCFLKDIDPYFAQEQFDSYKKDFADSRLGLPGIREHHKGITKGGDIDSGPVIWEIGGAASIVGQRTAALYGDWNTFQGLRNSIELFGAAHTWHGKKKYLFGEVPMADAFIAWSNVAASESDIETTSNWRWRFQLGTLLIVFLCLFVIKKLK